LSDGKIGYGEGVPRDYVTGETIDGTIELLKASELKRQLGYAHDFETVVKHAGALTLAEVPGDDRRCRGNAARCAVELAYLDAFGRSLGEPLMNVTTRIAPQLAEPRERVQYSGIILSAKGWKARLAALGYRVTGFGQVKVKVGIAGHDDARRMRVIRRCVGSKVELRVDANEAWTTSNALDKLRSIEPYRIAAVEQPVPHADIAAMKDIKLQCPIPIQLDESLCSMVDAERAIRGGYSDRWNLRLSKCGGFIPSLKLAAFAAERGVGYQLGCQVGETGILSAAGRHFATSVRGLLALEGSFDRHLLAELLTKEDITFGSRGGWAPMIAASGTGVRVDPARLDANTVHREVLIG